jgi:hypothetical protein
MSEEQRRAREAELRADHALGAVDASDRAELGALARERQDESYDLAAAAAALAFGIRATTPLPEHLAKKVMAGADAYLDANLDPAAPRADAGSISKSTTAAGAQVIVMPLASGEERRERVDYARWGGWVAAAACLVIAVMQGIAPRGSAAGNPAQSTRVALVAGSDASGTVASGELAWVASDERGTLRVRGLAPSAPGEEYEAWIVDSTRDGEVAVPLGHFAAGGSETVLDVRSPVQIAAARRLVVTVERAGGVLVSKRSRVALEGAFER